MDLLRAEKTKEETDFHPKYLKEFKRVPKEKSAKNMDSVYLCVRADSREGLRDQRPLRFPLSLHSPANIYLPNICFFITM